jgi:hypothetical protein
MTGRRRTTSTCLTVTLLTEDRIALSAAFSSVRMRGCEQFDDVKSSCFVPATMLATMRATLTMNFTYALTPLTFADLFKLAYPDYVHINRGNHGKCYIARFYRVFLYGVVLLNLTKQTRLASLHYLIAESQDLNGRYCFATCTLYVHFIHYIAIFIKLQSLKT